MGHVPPIFGSHPLRPNGCIDQDSPLGMEVRLGPGRVCVRLGPRLPSPKNFYCAQAAGCITMLLGKKVGLSPGDFVFDGDPPSSPKRGPSPSLIFGPCLLWPNGLPDQDETRHAGRPRSLPHCVRWGPSSPPPKGHSPQFSAHIRCGQMAV